MNRELKFGQLLAVARVLGERVFEEGKPSISEINWKKYSQEPMKVFAKIHADLMKYSHKFGETELELMSLFDEIFAEMSESEFDDKPLGREYLIGYYQQADALNNIISVQEASEMWGLSPDHVKTLCRNGDVQAKKIGNSWAVLKDQPNPKQRKKNEQA